jgi:dihydroorotase
MDKLTIKCPDDFHIHLRQGEELKNYARETARFFKRGVVMPNTIPPIISARQVIEYREQILGCTNNFEPLMTFKIIPGLDAMEVSSLKEAGAIIGKYYPAGATTNSSDGVTHWHQIKGVLGEMEKLGLVLSIHGEVPDSFILNREKDFLPILEEIVKAFPRLKIVLEHISSKEGIEYVKNAPENVAGTITLHHLIHTVEDVLRDGNNKCMPTPKLREDRDSIQATAFSGNPKFFFGSDSAPHLQRDKDNAIGKFGVYSAPVLLPKLVELFENFGVLDKLENFLSKFGADFYGLPYNNGSITLVKRGFTVPLNICGVKPFLAGEFISWSIEE